MPYDSTTRTGLLQPSVVGAGITALRAPHEELYSKARAEDLEDDLAAMRRRRTMRVELIGHFKPCMTEIYLLI